MGEWVDRWGSTPGSVFFHITPPLDRRYWPPIDPGGILTHFTWDKMHRTKMELAYCNKANQATLSSGESDK